MFYIKNNFRFRLPKFQAIECAPALLARVDSHNRRSLDTLGSKAYFYYTLANARANRHKLILELVQLLFFGCVKLF